MGGGLRPCGLGRPSLPPPSVRLCAPTARQQARAGDPTSGAAVGGRLPCGPSLRRASGKQLFPPSLGPFSSVTGSAQDSPLRVHLTSVSGQAVAQRATSCTDPAEAGMWTAERALGSPHRAPLLGRAGFCGHPAVLAPNAHHLTQALRPWEFLGHLLCGGLVTKVV